MSKQITISDKLNEQLIRLREENEDDEGKLASYSFVIKEALKEAGLWKKSGKKRKNLKQH